MKFLSVLLVSFACLFLGACPDNTPVNTSGCAWTKQIDAVANNDDIFIIFAANEHTMRPLTNQINTHNKERAKNCM